MTDEIRRLLIEAAYHAYWRTEDTVEGCPSVWADEKMAWCDGYKKCKHAKLQDHNKNYRYALNCWIRFWSKDKVSIDWDKEGEE